MARGRRKITVEKTGKYPPVMKGLQGICDLFGVTKSTAWKWKNGFLKDACSMQGRKILVDTEYALRLFGVKDSKKFVGSKPLK